MEKPAQAGRSATPAHDHPAGSPIPEAIRPGTVDSGSAAARPTIGGLMPQYYARGLDTFTYIFDMISILSPIIGDVPKQSPLLVPTHTRTSNPRLLTGVPPPECFHGPSSSPSIISGPRVGGSFGTGARHSTSSSAAANRTREQLSIELRQHPVCFSRFAERLVSCRLGPTLLWWVSQMKPASARRDTPLRNE